MPQENRERLTITSTAQGINDDGQLQVDIEVDGRVPTLPTGVVLLRPFTEDYVQSGEGSLYGYSSRSFQVNGYMLPYAWNHTVTYDADAGRLPFLVQSLFTTNLRVHYGRGHRKLKIRAAAAIRKGEPSNRCPEGFTLDESGPFCLDDDECVRMQPCAHVCNNVLGSYYCSCPDGMTLGPDGKSCQGRDQHLRSHDSGSSCSYLDECQLGMMTCAEGEECVNTIGSYQCVQPCGRE
ncbi:PREDICTED: hemicentin-1-like [Priapulus caudatus]|uniref:Hemicentin-1-like n=1 Tax=Priapulus caudatus TaxID=37621 RepID=A0ABM1EXL5_PRICU|nr:PREDICTED: hemicentin-1-like [Priapulus caudatus]